MNNIGDILRLFENTNSYLHDINFISVNVRLILAVLFGGTIGIERGKKSRPAGFRTYMLVCIGAALTMITNQYIVEQFGGTDPARLGAQVISGVGFLGVGTIIMTHNQRVKGLTTAAGLWATACMGLTIGIGFYVGAIVAWFYIVVAMDIMHKIDKIVRSKSTTINVVVEHCCNDDIKGFLEYCENNDITVSEMEFSQSQKGDITSSTVVIYLLKFKNNKANDHKKMITILRDIKGVESAFELK